MVQRGEGVYSLTSIKEIKVTEAFLGLGQEITNCHTKELRADCLTRRHREQVLASCSCAPFAMRSYYGEQGERPSLS